jgi:PhnB protein
VKPVPDGYHSATPYLIVKGAAAAIDFYQNVFGAVEFLRLPGARGTIAHAEIRIGDSVIMLADEEPEWNTQSPLTLGGSASLVHLYVGDVDAVASRAVAAGSTILIPVADQFYGDRAGRLRDPFGHLWVISTHIKDVSTDDMLKHSDTT